MRRIDWEGAVNALTVNDSLVRMARREWVTADGWEDAIAAGFTTVVDLRSPQEWATVRDGDQDMPDLEGRLELVSAPTEDPSHERFEREFGPFLNHPKGYVAYLDMFGDRVVEALRAIAEAPGGVIIHCSAGRDRTGLVVAIGQRLAGWSDDDIVAGYSAAATGINEWHRVNPHPTEKLMEGAVWESWLGERVDALRDFLTGFEAESFAAEHGLEQADLAAIRRRFRQTTVSNP